MAYTISFQNRPTLSRDHNMRNPSVVSKESHIDPDGIFEIWHDETLADAYERIFGGAVAEYNSKQTRHDRKITNYLKKIQNSNLKNPKKPAYECIVQVGNRDNKPKEEQSRAILKEFFEGWSKSNPQLEIIGAYYHADEMAGTPHLHIDYVPVGEGYKRGLKKQLSLSKALEMQGIKGLQKINNRTYTPQQLWQFKEVDRLEEICKSNRFDFAIVHPKREHRDHLHKEDFILQQKLAEKEAQIQQLQQSQREISNKISSQEEELFASSVMLQNQPSDLKTRLDAELWQAAKPYMKKIKLRSGKTAYEGFKEQNAELFKPWNERFENKAKSKEKNISDDFGIDEMDLR